MLTRCKIFVKDHNIMFSTDPNPSKSKTKAIYVTGPSGGGLTQPVSLQLCGWALPSVAWAEHLGHALHQNGTMRQDCKEKRAQLIDTSVKIREAVLPIPVTRSWLLENTALQYMEVISGD